MVRRRYGIKWSKYQQNIPDLFRMTRLVITTAQRIHTVLHTCAVEHSCLGPSCSLSLCDGFHCMTVKHVQRIKETFPTVCALLTTLMYGILIIVIDFINATTITKWGKNRLDSVLKRTKLTFIF